MKRSLLFLIALGSLGASAVSSCSSVTPHPDLGPSTFHVTVDMVNGMPPPTVRPFLCWKRLASAGLLLLAIVASAIVLLARL